MIESRIDFCYYFGVAYNFRKNLLDAIFKVSLNFLFQIHDVASTCCRTITLTSQDFTTLIQNCYFISVHAFNSIGYQVTDTANLFCRQFFTLMKLNNN
ncbi:hypothetical protein D3C87_1733240 [compost metagenome]